MSVIRVTKDNFEEIVINSDKTVLVDFFAEWCGPCKMVSPIVDEIAEECDDYTVVKIDVDESPELAVRYGIVSIPTLIVIRDGAEVNKAVGLRSKEQILDMLA